MHHAAALLTWPRNNGTPSLKTFSCALCDVITDLAHKQQLGSEIHGVEGQSSHVKCQNHSGKMQLGVQIPKHGFSIDCIEITVDGSR